MIYGNIKNSQHPVSGENSATYSPKQYLHTAPCFLPVCVLVRTREMVDTKKYMDPVGCPIKPQTEHISKSISHITPSLEQSEQSDQHQYQG